MQDVHACTYAVRRRPPSHPTRLVTEQAVGTAVPDHLRTVVPNLIMVSITSHEA